MNKFRRRVLTFAAVLALFGGAPIYGHAAETGNVGIVNFSVTNHCAFLNVGRAPNGFWHVTNFWAAPVFVVINSGGSVWGQNINPGQRIYFEGSTTIQCDAMGSIAPRPGQSEITE